MGNNPLDSVLGGIKVVVNPALPPDKVLLVNGNSLHVPLGIDIDDILNRFYQEMASNTAGTLPLGVRLGTLPLGVAPCVGLPELRGQIYYCRVCAIDVMTNPDARISGEHRIIDTWVDIEISCDCGAVMVLPMIPNILTYVP